MIEKVITNAKGEDTGVRAYYAHDGRELAKYYPATEEKWGTYPSGKKRLLQREREACLSVNTERTFFGGAWWEKSYIERIKPEYKKEFNELLARYEGAIVTEHSYM